MIRRTPLLEAFERQEIRRTPPDAAAGLAIFEALYLEACRLGVLPPEDPLEGIEVDVRLAKALHVRRAAREDRPRPR